MSKTPLNRLDDIALNKLKMEVLRCLGPVPRGLKLAAGLERNRMLSIDAESGNIDQEFLHTRQEKVAQQAPDGIRLDWSNGLEKAAILVVCFSPDGRTLAMGTSDGALRISDACSGNLRCEVIFEGKQKESWTGNLPDGPASLRDLSWSPDSKLLALGYDNRAAFRIIDAQSRALVFERRFEPMPHVPEDLANMSGSVTACSWRPDGSQVALGMSNKEFRILNAHSWDLMLEREIGEWWIPLAFRSPNGSILGVDWKKDGTQIALGSHDGCLRLMELEPWNELWSNGQAAPIIRVAWSPSGEFLATACMDGHMRCIDVETGDTWWKLKHGSAVLDVAWHPTGMFLATSADSAVRLLDVSDRRIRRKIKCGDAVRSLDWHPAGPDLW